MKNMIYLILKDGKPMIYEHYPNYIGVMAFKSHTAAKNHRSYLRRRNDYKDSKLTIKKVEF